MVCVFVCSSAGLSAVDHHRTVPVGFVLVEAGSFFMGSEEHSTERQADEQMHRVTIREPIYISRHEITQSEYLAITGENPSMHQGENLPVENVSWYDAILYCNIRSKQEGLIPCYLFLDGQILCDFSSDGYRLPTEAEWEFAARGGSDGNRQAYAGSDRLSSVGWYVDNADAKTHAVGSLEPNRLGLFDMSGNVSEWCWDWYGDYPNHPIVDPRGPTSGVWRVERGGGWYAEPGFCRTANRNSSSPRTTSGGLGFRVVRRAFKFKERDPFDESQFVRGPHYPVRSPEHSK